MREVRDAVAHVLDETSLEDACHKADEAAKRRRSG
jgi:hypothetical protein